MQLAAKAWNKYYYKKTASVHGYDPSSAHGNVQLYLATQETLLKMFFSNFEIVCLDFFLPRKLLNSILSKSAVLLPTVGMITWRERDRRRRCRRRHCRCHCCRRRRRRR